MFDAISQQSRDRPWRIKNYIEEVVSISNCFSVCCFGWVNGAEQAHVSAVLSLYNSHVGEIDPCIGPSIFVDIIWQDVAPEMFASLPRVSFNEAFQIIKRGLTS